MISILPSSEQTKQWRSGQPWYVGGKQNECEVFQQKCLHQITGQELTRNTHLRLHLDTKELTYKKNPLLHEDGFEYTEDFDGCLNVMKYLFYVNLKFVCSVGGSQYRTLRETYHFIQTQLEHLVRFPDPNKYFVNILEGNCSHQSKTKFNYLLKKEKFSSVQHQVFVGDMFQFQTFWQEFFSLQQQETENTMKKKQQLGQFFTTNYHYILQNLWIPEKIKWIVEPFAGAGDLLHFISDHSKYNLECYDIDPQDKQLIIQRDTLLDPPCFQDKFVITNPPYLARNKCADKTIFDKYGVNDLYKCFLMLLLKSPCQGGILIIPINFWCSGRDKILRQKFLQQYEILYMNIFEEPVFQDTDYSVCSFLFMKKQNPTKPIPIMIFPEKKETQLYLQKENDYMMGGEIFHLPRTNEYTITRRTRLNKDKPFTNILVKCIDDEHPISLSVIKDQEKSYIDETPNLSARSYATLVIEPTLTEEEEYRLVKKFNTLLTEYRSKYHSLFLTTYREYKRKRISFDLVYHIVGHLLET